MGYRIAAINDECETCSRCGKTGLKRVAWVFSEEDGPGSAAPVGLDCTAILLGYGKRVQGRVAAKAIQQVVLDWYIARWTEFLATRITAEVSTKRCLGLRADEFDFIVRIGDFTSRSDTRHGLQHALNYAGQELAMHRMGELARTWRQETGLASAPNKHAEWPSAFRGRYPVVIPQSELLAS
jgi:hypothetical protein